MYLFPCYWRRPRFAPPVYPDGLVSVTNSSRGGIRNVRDGGKEAGVQGLEQVAVVAAEAGVELAQETLQGARGVTGTLKDERISPLLDEPGAVAAARLGCPIALFLPNRRRPPGNYHSHSVNLILPLTHHGLSSRLQ